MPLVLSDASGLDFDRSDGSSCVYAESPNVLRPDQPPHLRRRDELHHPAGRHPSLRRRSRQRQDHVLGPGRPAQPAFTRAADDQSAGPPGVSSVPSASGFENLGVGITWAAFNQVRDDTKPTWTLSFDALLDVFKGMAVRPVESGREHRGGPRLPPAHLVHLGVEAVPLLRSVLRRLVRAADPDQRQPLPELRTHADQPPTPSSRRAYPSASSRSPGRTPARAAGDDRGARLRRGVLLRPQPQRDLAAAVGAVDLHDEHPQRLPSGDRSGRTRRQSNNR